MANKESKTPPEPGKDKLLQIVADPGKSHDRLVAEVAAAGMAGNASTLIAFTQGAFGQMSLTECALVLEDSAKAVHGGDLSAAERMLTAQAAALNAIFGELARRAALNMGEYMDATDRYMRLALKAQTQCRATLETLAAIKNPPVVFARQANFANGPQQVNNGMTPDSGPIRASARAENLPSVQSGLLEVKDGEWLDTRATGTPSGADPKLATVGAVDRAADG